MHWSETISRPMPWKEEKNPYLIWLSEIILQQTRVEQGLPYYLKFAAKYPTVFDLANVGESALMKDWEGLGYYSRARNLHEAAKMIVENHQGIFPKDINEIKKLKGIGDYTAAAIASFAYNAPFAVLDGNVFRVLSRVFNIELPIDTTIGKNYFLSVAQEALDQQFPAKYNQAIMDFGATHCLPSQPKCQECVMNKICIANQKDIVSILPIKSKKLLKKIRNINYLVYVIDDQTLISETTQSVWKGLFQFPMVESDKAAWEIEDVQHFLTKEKIGYLTIKKEFSDTQNLTHQRINANFWKIEVIEFPKLENTKKVSFKNINNFPYPKIIKNYLSSIHK